MTRPNKKEIALKIFCEEVKERQRQKMKSLAPSRKKRK